MSLGDNMKIPLFIAEDYTKVYNFLWLVIAVFVLSGCSLLAGASFALVDDERYKVRVRWLFTAGGVGFVSAGVVLLLAYVR